MSIQIVSFNCVLKNRFGHVISSTYNRDVLTHDPSGQEGLIELARGLQNIKRGERRQISLRADQAYGFYDLNKVIELPCSELHGAKNLRVGDPVKYAVEGQQRLFRVTQISGGIITLDANHPLAGQDLVFEVEVTEARDATPEEISGAGFSESGAGFH